MSFAFRLLRSFEGMTGTVILVLLSLTALAAPAVFPGDPLAIVGEPLITPFTDAALPLGTDRLAATCWPSSPMVRRPPCSSAWAPPQPR